jgi:acetolactate synthase I/II/III large subunit
LSFVAGLPMNAPTALSNATRPMTGGQAMAEMLKLAGVGPMFGMGGFQLLPFYEACRALGLKHYLINDERCAVFAGDAYARVTNRPGVCDATLGPGATNLVTGLVESLNAGVAQVVFAGDSNRQHAWKNMTQESRQVEILRPAAKELIRVEVASRVPELVRRAFAVATSGRAGPVVVDVPEDVAHQEVSYDAADFWIDPATTRMPARRFRPDGAEIEKVAALLAGARKPLLLVGGGIHLSQAWEATMALAEAQALPVAHTISGKGAIPCTHRLSAGLFGRYSRIANDMIAEADLLIVVGCKLGEIATKRFQLIPPGVPLVHIDIVPEELGRTTRADLALVGDAKLSLEDLAAAMPARPVTPDRVDWAASVATRMAVWRESASDKLDSAETPINVGRLMNEINKTIPDDGVLVADGGFAGHWSGLLFDTQKAGRHFIADRGFASIGYGVPGSLGAQLGAGKRRVIGLTGDGGFNMTIGDLETALRAKAPFVLCVVNNAASGYVKALQHAVYGPGNYQSSDLVEMDYAALAKNFRCHGIRVTDPEKISAALREGLENTDTPTILDVVVTRDPGKMLPGVDNRTLKVTKGDRPV